MTIVDRYNNYYIMKWVRMHFVGATHRPFHCTGRNAVNAIFLCTPHQLSGIIKLCNAIILIILKYCMFVPHG